MFLKKGSNDLKRFAKILKFAVIAAVIGGVGYGIYWYMSEDIEVRCLTLEPTAYTDSFTEKAYVKSGDSINCVSENAGQILSVMVHKNQTVKKGDVIAVISSKDLEFERQTVQDEIDTLRAGLNQTKQKDGYDKKDIKNSINELDVELEKIENARKQKKYEKTMEVSPQTYLDVLKTAVDAAKTDLDYNKNELEKKKQLFTAGVITKTELDEAQNSYDTAYSNHSSAVQKYDDAFARAQSESTENSDYYKSIQEDFDIQLDSIYAKRNSLESQLANDNISAAENEVNSQIAEKQTRIDQINDKISRCTVKAQADGVISDLPAEKINRIEEGGILAVIKPDSTLRAEADVLTNEEPYLKTGDPVKLTHKLKSDSAEYTGSIAEIYNYAEKTTSALGNDEYRVKIVIALDDAAALKDGYELEAQFTTYSSDNALTVPNSALYKKDDVYHMFINDNGKAKEVPVELAHRGNISSEIKSGAASGSEVIIDANTKDLVDGSGIKVTNVK